MKTLFSVIFFAISLNAQAPKIHISGTRSESDERQIDKDLKKISSDNWMKKPSVWLTPETAKALSRVTSRGYITKIERRGDVVVYTWTNGLRGAVTTQKVEKLVSKPARDVRLEQLDTIKSEAEKVRKERDVLKSEINKLKKGNK